jgi:hypothetical protein
MIGAHVVDMETKLPADPVTLHADAALSRTSIWKRFREAA